MARSKRKRNPTRTKPNKRPRYVDSSASEPDDESKLWEADCIVEERFIRGVKKYYIKWKGTDPSTGKDWPNTWEPAENANDELVADWQEEKARRSGHSVLERSETRTKHRASRRIRNSRVIDSSPESTSRSSPTSAPSTPTHHRAGSVNSSSAAVSPVGIPTSSRRVSPRIHIRRRGESLERNKFQLVSQISSPQPISAQAHSQETDIDISQCFAATRLYSSGIVPMASHNIGPRDRVPQAKRALYSLHNTQKTPTNKIPILALCQRRRKRKISRTTRYVQNTACSKRIDLLTDVCRVFLKSFTEQL